MQKLGRNDSCHCGSGLKYKKCCLNKDEDFRVTRLVASQPLSLTDTIDHEMEWPNELHRLIAHHFLNHTIDVYKQEQIAGLILAWNRFASDTQPVSKKLGVYPAALEYVLCLIFAHPTTQSELAKKYDVSVATLSQRANQLFDYIEEHDDLSNELAARQLSVPDGSNSSIVMEQEMARLHALLDQQNFNSIDEINDFLAHNMNNKPVRGKKANKEEQASELLYAAWNEPNPHRKMQLAQEALQLDPQSGDAYNILAEGAASPKEMAYFYKQGMLVEEKRLGQACFKENKGHFWMYPPTRPYMRAKKGYAEICAQLDKMPEAIQHYRELLELNPNDNQGVRDLLLPAYIETKDWHAAEQLIRQYDEDGSASFKYARVIVEYGINGRSPKLQSLIKTAVEHNPFVPTYLKGKKRLPRTMPDYMGYGDDREAIVYALLNRHLWLTHPELLQLLPEQRK
ncbi:SEC-C motif-containing protein [Paenibacillus cellulosilyticus]|uniref:SEC-C motif-containing protein n=1 Tax=Paenibacillus cellulosilyticus TaxID=375489 RepID=A0A2V2YXV3_9BACL|nr:SEC-C metal-binding domain-containing protein [Paenibacillus cellulosilyticus]PWW03163.1 SEC-C motif-containing protein [Paenibacillus cellulosilyticus]